MSNRERCNAILDTFDDFQLVNIVAMLQAAKGFTEAADDAYCAQLYQSYLDDDSPNRDEVMSEEEVCKALCVVI